LRVNPRPVTSTITFASQADKEGYKQIAAIFNETAENEKEHAKRLYKFLMGGGNTSYNNEPARCR